MDSTPNNEKNEAFGCLPVIVEAILPELRALPQWVTWIKSVRNRKATKLPINPISIAAAAVDDPTTWGTFDAALVSAHRRKHAGVGFVFSPDDDFVGIDLDACRNPETGELTPWASDIARRINSYTEVSPSGTGVKIVFRGKMPDGSRNVKKLKGVPTFGSKAPEIAIYDRGRFWCMNGQRLPDVPPTCEPRQEQLNALSAELFPARPASNGGSRTRGKARPDWFSARLKDCATAPEGERSERDFSLCVEAVRHGCDPDEIWERVKDVGKFEEKGRAYFDTTWQNASERAAEGSDSGSEAESQNSDPTQAQQLITLADEVELWHTDADIAYATVKIEGHAEHYPVTSRQFRRWLHHRFFESTGSAPTSSAFQSACAIIEAKAIFKGEEHGLFVRAAEHSDSIYVDLGNRDRQAIEITADGWSLVANPPVRFRRAKGMLPLPLPVAGGSLVELRKFVNVSDEHWPLVGAWLVVALRASGPYPLLCLHGEQGSGKSTQARMLRALVDPNVAPIRCEPKEARDLMISANNGWVIALDNLSYVPPWLSDCLCRLSTGGGFSTRTLYENDEETIFESMRPIILTGIQELATQSDLIDRSLLINLPTIPEGARKTEKDLWHQFEEAMPRIFGALLDALVCAIRNLPKTKLDRMPRMADFALWATAAEPALGFSEGEIMRSYQSNRESANQTPLDASLIAPYIIELADKENGGWQSTAAILLKHLECIATDADRRQRAWPKTAHKLSGDLWRLASNLRRIGVEVTFLQTAGKHSKKLITITRRRSETCDASDASDAKTENASEPGSKASQNGVGDGLQY